MGADHLEDEDVPSLTTGQAAAVLGVQPAFLRSLDTGRVLSPHRSTGGHRRYTRRQLGLAARMRTLTDEGFSLSAAAAVVSLQDRVDEVTRERDAARAELAQLHRDATRARISSTGGPAVPTDRSGTTVPAADAADTGRATPGTGLIARPPSSAPAHPGPGHHRARGIVSSPARPSTTHATTTDTTTP